MRPDLDAGGLGVDVHNGHAAQHRLVRRRLGAPEPLSLI